MIQESFEQALSGRGWIVKRNIAAAATFYSLTTLHFKILIIRLTRERLKILE